MENISPSLFCSTKERHVGEQMMTEYSFLGERMLNYLPRTWTQICQKEGL